jgi:homoserine O-acetyltransferase
LPPRSRDPAIDYETFDLGDVALQSGQTLRGARLAYKTYGALNAKRDNVIIYPCFSTSPSNTGAPYNGARFPKVTAYDNIVQQHRLIVEKFGIERIKLVTGWSMGALQSYHWAALLPDMVERILLFQGSAKCSTRNFVPLEGVRATLELDPHFSDGLYKEQPIRGMRAAARIFAAGGCPTSSIVSRPTSNS